VKFKRSEVIAKVSRIPDIRFEDQEETSLTSFAGLVIYQSLFGRMKIKQRLQKCFQHLAIGSIYSFWRIFLWLVVHLILGYRGLRDRDYYAEDPLVLRLLGLLRLPDTGTISRMLAKVDPQAVENLRTLSREIVLERLVAEDLARVTLDFDGSVLSTSRHAEGTAIGYNKKKKGARSYYPLFCTVAQTAQIFDLLHRSGNVHDSNGARPFIRQCIDQVRGQLPQAKLEARIDSAFFDERILFALALEEVEFTASVPFERFPKLKSVIEARRRFHRIDGTWSYFECDWKPESWLLGFRILVIRQKKARPTKGPLQLDLFEPKSHEYDYQVIITNKTTAAKSVMEFHHGRGAQEGIFAEAKSHCQLEYVPVRSRCGNQTYCLAAIMAHNLTRELQMQVHERSSGTTRKRCNLWGFETLNTLRQRLVRRAGRLIRPQGRLTLVTAGNAKVRSDLDKYLSPSDN
jgi:hypothetical protein